MGKVIAATTTSVDGRVVGPDDRPGQGLGRGGEHLHYWVMGGPWTYEDDGHDTDGMQASTASSSRRYRRPRGGGRGPHDI